MTAALLVIDSVSKRSKSSTVEDAKGMYAVVAHGTGGRRCCTVASLPVDLVRCSEGSSLAC